MDTTNLEEYEQLLLPIPSSTLQSLPAGSTAISEPNYFQQNWEDPQVYYRQGFQPFQANTPVDHTPFKPNGFYPNGPRTAPVLASPAPKKHNINSPRTPLGHPSGGLFEATYSNIQVYEFIINDVAIMRRKRDSWVNGTHILKAAGVDKGKRTKILEKEVHHEDHEKVQGGYGRYQGTWYFF